jgi:hypothetical protein
VTSHRKNSIRYALGRSFLSFVLFVPASLIVVAASSSTATAEGSQNPTCQRHTYGNDFDGYKTNTNNNYNGSYAYIQQEQALLCTSDKGTDNFSTAWAMLAGHASGQNGDNYDFAQVGYSEWYGRGTHWFDAYEEDKYGFQYTEYDDWADTVSSGEINLYAVTKAQNDPTDCQNTLGHSCIVMLEDGQLVGATQFPWSNGIATFPAPYHGEFFGETWYFTSDVPGTYTAATFSNLGWMSAGYVESHDFSPNTLYGYDSDTYWYRLGGLTSGPTFKIWDGLS